MKLIILITFLFCSQSTFGQDLQHNLTHPEDSSKLMGLQLFVEMDSIHTINETDGIKFSLVIRNNGPGFLTLDNPLYDTRFNLKFYLYTLPSKKRIKLKQIARMPDPTSGVNYKPYSIDQIVRGGIDVDSSQFREFWEQKTLTISPDEEIRYDLNLYEQVLIDGNIPSIGQISPGKYYGLINIAITVGDYEFIGNPLEFKIRLIE